MRLIRSQPSPAAAIFALAEIKAVVEAFDHGDSNVFDVLDAIIEVIEAHRVIATSEPRRDAA